MTTLTIQILYYLSLIVAIVASVWITRAIMARDKPSLQPWHLLKLDGEYTAKKYPSSIEFTQYQALERELVEEIRTKIELELEDDQKNAINRFNPESPAHRHQWPQDWNLSFERLPEKDPVGAIILLHGASDSPYSMRALSQTFIDMGLAVIALRLPGNGTIPSELTRVRPEDWTSILPIGMQRATEHIEDSKPVFVGGYSTGATLAIDYALSSLQSNELRKLDGIILFSPAIQVSVAARFAAWDNFFSRFKVFNKFAWLTIWPEYDPFKYSSFAKRAVSIVRELTAHNMSRMEEARESGRWKDFPPVITFQSVVDVTVSVPSVFDFHRKLEHPTSQLVMFDVNRKSSVAPFLDESSADIIKRATSEKFNATDITIVRNQSTSTGQVSAFRYSPSDDKAQTITDLNVAWPSYFVSLSHVAVPFPEDDLLYGRKGSNNGYNLNNIHVKGEKAVLLVPAEELNRTRFNPFYAYMTQRIEAFLIPLIKSRD